MGLNIQAVAWLLLVAFNEIYSKNTRQKVEQKGIFKYAVWKCV